MSGHCEAVDDIGLSLSLSATPLATKLGGSTRNGSAATLSDVYQMLVKGVGPQVSKATANAFALPPRGALGALHLRRGTTSIPWYPIVTTGPYSKSNHGVTINTHKQHPFFKGSQAVSVGNVACRQMGFGGAVLVTNCRGLQILHERIATSARKAAVDQVNDLLGCSTNNTGGDDNTDALKSQSSKSWIAVESDAPLSIEASLLHGHWLPGSNHSFHGPPPWAVHSGWPESWCVGNEVPVAPTGVAPDPCEITPDTGMTSPAIKRVGICARTAGAVAHCYRDQLERALNDDVGNACFTQSRHQVLTDFFIFYKLVLVVVSSVPI